MRKKSKTPPGKDFDILSNIKSDNIMPITPKSPTILNQINSNGIWMISQNIKKLLENNTKSLNK